MDLSNSLIPIGVVVAIVIFLVKEVLEFFRRRNADRRKVAALKRVFERELELNLGTIKNIKGIVSNARSILEDREGQWTFDIEKNESGERKFVTYHPNGDLMGSTPIRKTNSEALAKHLVDVAALDSGLFDKVKSAYDAQMELIHVRDSVIRYFPRDSSEIDAELLLPFCEYAEAELSRSQAALNSLYLACTGKPLERDRLR